MSGEQPKTLGSNPLLEDGVVEGSSLLPVKKVDSFPADPRLEDFSVPDAFSSARELLSEEERDMVEATLAKIISASEGSTPQQVFLKGDFLPKMVYFGLQPQFDSLLSELQPIVNSLRLLPASLSLVQETIKNDIRRRIALFLLGNMQQIQILSAAEKYRSMIQRALGREVRQHEVDAHSLDAVVQRIKNMNTEADNYRYASILHSEALMEALVREVVGKKDGVPSSLQFSSMEHAIITGYDGRIGRSTDDARSLGLKLQEICALRGIAVTFEITRSSNYDRQHPNAEVPILLQLVIDTKATAELVKA